MREIIRFLSPEEFTRNDIVKVFADNSNVVPNPLVSKILIAEDENNGELLGFLVLQPAYHIEPIYIAPDKRNSLLYDRMIKGMFTFLHDVNLPEVFASADNDRIANLAKHYGFRETGIVLKREL